MIDAQQRAAAKAFAKNWKDRGYEKGDSQIFWVELLTTVFGVTEISQFISFEDQVHLDHTDDIDREGRIWYLNENVKFKGGF